MKKGFVSRGIVILLSFMLLTACNKSEVTTGKKKNAGEDTTIYVFIAASLNNAMETVKEMYHQNYPNVEIVYNADSSGTLKTQIEEGAECDVFFSAAMKQMTGLDEEGYILKDSIVKLLENQVVLIKPKGGKTAVSSFDTITNAKNLALAGEDVPVGAYAREIFTNMGMLDQIMTMELNECANVTAVLAAVTEASNEVGIVYATDAYSAIDSVEILASAPSEYLKTPVIYPVGLVMNQEADEVQKQAAIDFIEFLKTDEVIDVFEECGFVGYKESAHE